MKKRKCLIVEEMNYSATFVSILFKLFSWDVYYYHYRSCPRFARKQFIPLSLESIERPFEKGFSLKTTWLEGVKKTFQRGKIFPKISEVWGVEDKNKNKILASFCGYFITTIYDKVYPHVLANELLSEYPSVVLLDNKGPFSLYVVGAINRSRYKYLYLPDIAFFPRKAWKIIGRIKNRFSLSKKKHNNEITREHAPNNQGKVLFFPHKGVFYGDLFLKDHYFFDHIEGLSPKEMSFVAYGDRSVETEKSKEWLIQQDIGVTDLHIHFPKHTKQIRRILSLFKLIDYSSLYSMVVDFISIKFFNHTENYRESLSRFTQAKAAVFGFDILVPRTLTLALFLKKIKTLATQERLFPCFMKSHPLVLDTYLTISPLATAEMKKYPDFYAIDKFCSAGPIRMSKYPSLVEDHKYESLSKGRKIILILPFHFPRTAEENRFSSTNSWKTNRFFYEKIIDLAKIFPNLFFVIKEKEVTLPKIKSMASIVDDIEKCENLHYEENIKEYSPFKISAICDGCIAMNTSLGDEILYLRKPVIFYDFGYSIPLPYFSYGDCDIMAENFEELVEKTKRFFVNNEPVPNLETLYPSSDKSYAKKILETELRLFIE